jgi:NTE family protein
MGGEGGPYGERPYDLVLEGGGVKGVGLVGAVVTLAGQGWRPRRIAGVSAGAITGAVLAGLQRAGEEPDRLKEILDTLDMAKFRDEGRLGKLFGMVGNAFDYLLTEGLYKGDYLTGWLEGVLADLGVRTWADLKCAPDPASDAPAAHWYRLVVGVSDLSRRAFVELPWQYDQYQLPADEMPVAQAVRASASLPFFFRPVELACGDGGTATLGDGGLLSKYPIGIFDRTDGKRPRWPTFGVKLSAKEIVAPPQELHGPIGYAVGVIETLITGHDAQHVNDPCSVARTIFVDTLGIPSTRFELREQVRDELYANGVAGATTFLAGWDWTRWLATCKGQAV